MQIVKRKPAGHRFVDMSGKRIGKLKVKRFAGFANRFAVWECKCVCGSLVYVRGAQLRGGQSSCGCINKTALGRSTRREYATWFYLPRGHICRRWRTFANFFADMGEQPAGHYLSLRSGKRIFSKDNCRWSIFRRPTIGSKAITWPTDSVVKTVTQLARELGISRQAFYQRLRKGIPVRPMGKVHREKITAAHKRRR